MECPTELREAIASIIFSAPRCSDLPDLLHVRNLFAGKYGKEFIAAASELRPETSVNRIIIEKLTVSAPSPEVKLKVLKLIALEYNISWDSTKTETEFSKKPEDLLNGPKQIAALPRAQSRPKIVENSLAIYHSWTSLNGKHGGQSPPSLRNTPSVAPRIVESSSSDQNLERVTDKKNSNSQSYDVLQQARAAIAAAERASATARAVAELVNARFISPKLDERKT